MVQMTVACAPANQRSLQAKLPNGSFQLARCRFGIRGGQGGEALEAIGMSGTGLSNQIVHTQSCFDGSPRLEIV
jgi:hypothetical protein